MLSIILHENQSLFTARQNFSKIAHGCLNWSIWRHAQAVFTVPKYWSFFGSMLGIRNSGKYQSLLTGLWTNLWWGICIHLSCLLRSGHAQANQNTTCSMFVFNCTRCLIIYHGFTGKCVMALQNSYKQIVLLINIIEHWYIPCKHEEVTSDDRLMLQTA